MGIINEICTTLRRGGWGFAYPSLGQDHDDTKISGLSPSPQFFLVPGGPHQGAIFSNPRTFQVHSIEGVRFFQPKAFEYGSSC